jgi:hypothetical protein
MGLTLKLTGLLPTMSCLTIYVILSILLGLLVLGFHWDWLPQWHLTLDPTCIVYHQTQALHRTPLSSLPVLCQCCSKLSLLRSLAWLFVWLWQILEQQIICYQIVLPSSPTSQFISSVFAWEITLTAHIHNCGCGFLGSFEMGMHVYFLGVVLSVDTSTDCHLSYAPLVSCPHYLPFSMSNHNALLPSIPWRVLPFKLAQALLRLQAISRPGVWY